MQVDSKSGQRVFITGGTGFLGLNIIDELLHEGHNEIFALHRKGAHLTELKQRPVTLCEGSITEPATLKQAFPDDIDLVFHVAGDTSLWQGANRRQRSVNVDGTRNMIDIAVQKQVRRFVYTSSLAAYGLSAEIISEQTVSNAKHCGINYCSTKFEAEQLVKQAVADGILDAVIVNPGAIMGPFDRTGWSRLVIMLQNGEFPFYPTGSLCLAHVRDIAKAHLAAAQRGISGENYLLGGAVASYKDLMEAICKALDCSSPQKTLPNWVYRLIGLTCGTLSFLTRKEPLLTPEMATMLISHAVCDDQKARQKLGLQHQPVENIVNDCLRWMKTNKLLQPSV